MSSTNNNSFTEPKPSNIEHKERRAYNIVRYWRWAHLAISMATVITCGATFLCQSYVNAIFYPNCMLNADCNAMRTPGGKLMFQSCTTWGAQSTCNFTQHSYAFAAVAAIILGWFFLRFRPCENTFFQRKATIASLLVFPGILVSLVFFIICLISAIIYQTGVQTWCNSVTRIYNISSCCDVQNIQIKGKPILNFYSFITTAQVMAWIGTFLWIVHLGLVLLRFFKHPDFPTYFYQSESPGPTATHHSGLAEDTSFPPSAIVERQTKETCVDDISSPKHPPIEQIPVKVTIDVYGSTALIGEGIQTTSEL